MIQIRSTLPLSSSLSLRSSFSITLSLSPPQTTLVPRKRLSKLIGHRSSATTIFNGREGAPYRRRDTVRGVPCPRSGGTAPIAGDRALEESPAAKGRERHAPRAKAEHRAGPVGTLMGLWARNNRSAIMDDPSPTPHSTARSPRRTMGQLPARTLRNAGLYSARKSTTALNIEKDQWVFGCYATAHREEHWNG